MLILRSLLAVTTLLAGSVLARSVLAADVPKVALSEQHRAMCVVGVGDSLPELELQTPNGDRQSLEPLLGKQATVIAFCRSGQQQTDQQPTAGWMTRALLGDLAPDVAGPMSKRGVAVVAVGIGGPLEVGEGCLSLVDPNGEAFTKLGEGRLPRVYVVDPAGKILWFDIEYSPTTRRELRRTLAAVLGDGPPAVAEAPRDAK